MKIVYLYTALTTIGGADRIVTQKMNYLAENLGHDVYVITDTQRGRTPIFPLSTKVTHIDVAVDFGSQYVHQLPFRFIYYQILMKKYKIKINEYLNKIKPDIVISTLGRDMDFLTSLTDGSKKIGESHIAKPYMRNFHLMEAKGGIYKYIAKYWRRKQEKAIRKLDAFVVLTHEDAQSWNEVRKSIVIPNMMTIETDIVSSCKGKTIISVGRYSEQKGYDLLIESWKIVAQKHPDWCINIYGEGELKDSLQQQINTANLQQQIKLCQPVTNITKKYLESTFYVMSSRFEGFGLVLMEAMNCGLPCVSFDCPYGPSGIIRHQEDGLLVDNGNIHALAESICYMIENQEKRIEMGKKAKENIQRYSRGSIMAQWESLFQLLVNK